YSQTTAEELYFAANDVYPSLIRVEADEATYNLHIIIRYDIEKKLIEGNLNVNDVQDEWNARYHSDLGVKVDSERNGVLQDVHWSAGLFGYFPTYTIGNLIAAQLFHSAQNAISNLDNQISNGSFNELLLWTREAIHKHGRSLNSDQMVQRSTGMSLSPKHLVQYLGEKLEALYDL
ncbi:MAG: carboxypeptidase M32, partial [Rubripirellula sp.]